ncbi:MAG: hypothetical protein ACRCZE_01920 [Candidatus Altimarinota bacterium]
MRVKYIGENIGNFDYGLSHKSIYTVYGLEVRQGDLFALLYRKGHLSFFPINLFEIVNSKVSKYWSFQLKQKVLSLSPKIFFENIFFEKFSDFGTLEREKFAQIAKKISKENLDFKFSTDYYFDTEESLFEKTLERYQYFINRHICLSDYSDKIKYVRFMFEDKNIGRGNALHSNDQTSYVLEIEVFADMDKFTYFDAYQADKLFKESLLNSLDKKTNKFADLMINLESLLNSIEYLKDVELDLFE